MKWKILSVLVAAILVGLVLSLVVPTESVCADGVCTDSDQTAAYPDGINPCMQGTACDPNQYCETDLCLWGIYLIEYYCGDNHYLNSTWFDCTDSGGFCQNGRCVLGGTGPGPTS